MSRIPTVKSIVNPRASTLLENHCAVGGPLSVNVVPGCQTSAGSRTGSAMLDGGLRTGPMATVRDAGRIKHICLSVQTVVNIWLVIRGSF